MDRTQKPFTRAELEASGAKLQRDGRMFNAVVLLAEIGGRKWTVKDFASRPFFVQPAARVLMWRELNALERLRGIDGISDLAFMVDSHCLAVSYIEGRTLRLVPKEEVTAEFLTALERLTKRMHEAGVVHLDLRSLSNVLMRPDGSPALIDFQAALSTDHMPGWLRKLLEDIDMSGAYKKWLRYRPDEMGEERRAELKRINRLRKLWVLHGYFGMKKKPRNM